MYCLHVQKAKFDIAPITHNYWDKLRLNYILNNWVITIRGSGGRSSPEARGYFNAKSENFNTRKNFFGGLVGGIYPAIPPPWIRPCVSHQTASLPWGGGAKNLCTPAYFSQCVPVPFVPPPLIARPHPSPHTIRLKCKCPPSPAKANTPALEIVVTGMM